MKELEKFVGKISSLNQHPLDIVGAREIVNAINKFLLISKI